MSDLLQLLPIYLFMLIPIWIPVVAVAVGAVGDALRGTTRTVRGAADLPGHPTRSARPVNAVGRLAPEAGTSR